MSIDISFYMDENRHQGTLAVAEEQTSGIFVEAAEEYLELEHNYLVNAAKIEAFTEATARELEINIAKCELKCLEENGTTAQLMYLEDAAEGGAIDKIKKLIQAAIREIKDWISGVKSKVLSKIASAEARQTIKTAEKKIKLNPILARKKVEVPNNKNAMSIINKYKGNIDKITSKVVVKGIVAESTLKTISETKESFRKDFKSAIAGKAAVKMITLTALVAEIASDINKLPAMLDNTENVHTSVLTKLQATISPEAAAAAQLATNTAVAFRNELIHEEVNVVVDEVMDKMKALKNAIKGKKNTVKLVQVKDMRESAEDEDLDGSDLYNESAEYDDYDDIDLYDESAEDEDMEGYDEYDESVSNDAMDELDAILDDILS